MSYRRGDYKKAKRGAYGWRISENKRIAYGGKVFTISRGYATLQHYAHVMRLNRRLLDRNTSIANRDALIKRYDREIARLVSVGL